MTGGEKGNTIQYNTTDKKRGEEKTIKNGTNVKRQGDGDDRICTTWASPTSVCPSFRFLLAQKTRGRRVCVCEGKRRRRREKLSLLAAPSVRG